MSVSPQMKMYVRSWSSFVMCRTSLHHLPSIKELV